MINEDEESSLMNPELEVLHEDEHILIPEQVVPALPPTPSRVSIKTMITIAIGAIVVLIAGLSMFVYTQPFTNASVERITKTLPFPAVMVGRHAITFRQYYEEQAAISSYLASLGQPKESLPSQEQLHSMILDTLVKKVVIKKFASDFALTLDRNSVEEYYQQIVKSGDGEENLQKQLRETFGWSTDVFKDRIVSSIVIASQVSDFISRHAELQAPQRLLIENAFARVNAGEDFATVADETHEQARVTINSDLGFIKTSELPPVWASSVTSLEVGAYSDVIELPEGYAFFKNVEKKDSGEKEQIHLLAITIPKKNLDAVVEEYLARVKIRKFIKV